MDIVSGTESATEAGQMEIKQDSQVMNNILAEIVTKGITFDNSLDNSLDNTTNNTTFDNATFKHKIEPFDKEVNKESFKREYETEWNDVIEMETEKELAKSQGYGKDEEIELDLNTDLTEISSGTKDRGGKNTDTYFSNSDMQSSTHSQTSTSSDPSEKLKKAPKSVLFLDIDDVVLNTGKAILDVLNARFELHGEEELKLEDIKEWNFYSVLERINKVFKDSKELQKKLPHLRYPIGKDYILEILEVPDFWVRVELAEGFNEMIEVALKYYEVILLTQGTYINLSNKVDYLGKRAQIELYRKDKDSGRYCQFCGLDFKASKREFINSEYMQRQIDGRFTVQIDDKYENLDSSCDLKILLRNHKDTDYNQISEYREDVYIMDTMKEVEDTLRFYAENDYRSIGKD